MLIFALCKWLQDMATFTYFYEIFSTKLFCNMKVAGPGEILSSKNFHVYNILAYTLLAAWPMFVGIAKPSAHLN